MCQATAAYETAAIPLTCLILIVIKLDAQSVVCVCECVCVAYIFRDVNIV